jgi:hypothetical protein
MQGSSLEAMADAIENSHCVLMCMTEAYKQSTNCRAEAEYAFQLKKPIVPLIMQKSYKPTGWLGIILGVRIFVDFTKYDHAECVKRLLKELNAVFGSRKETNLTEQECRIETRTIEMPVMAQMNEPEVIAFPESRIVHLNQTRTENKPVNEASSWNQEQVENWIREKTFSELIVKNVCPCDGSLLEQYYIMSQSTPEFFFKSLNPNGQVSLRECALFAKELKILFK